MALTSIEILALIFAIIASVKILVILINPAVWLGVVKKVYVQPVLTMIISLILSIIVLLYLISELTIIQIFAVMLFVALIAAVGLSMYSKETLKLAEKYFKDKKILVKNWFYIFIWVILIVWVFFEIF